MPVVASGADTEISFRRSISHVGVSTYSLDGKRMSLDAYTGQLESIGISSEAKNFLVMQGDIETFAQKDAKAMTKHVRQTTRAREKQRRRAGRSNLCVFGTEC